MKKTILLLAFPIFCALTSCDGGSDDAIDPSSETETTKETTSKQVVNVNQNNRSADARYGRLEFPRLADSNNYVIIHTTSDNVDPDGINYCVEWDYKVKAQRWTCYQITKAGNKQNVSRKDYGINPQYPIDPELPLAYYLDRPSADYTTKDYFYYSWSGTYSGEAFDHGHICPSYDRLYSRESNDQTFYLTNMQPQYNNFNAGVWLSMENFVHKVGNSLSTEDTLYICKGGTIGDVTIDGVTSSGVLKYVKDATAVGGDSLLVPKYFFSTFIVKKKGQYGAFAFWAEHKNTKLSSSAYLNDYIISIDELERRTGIDFFCNFPDETENYLEAIPAEQIITAWSAYSNIK